jgi:hypothetical protein
MVADADGRDAAHDMHARSEHRQDSSGKPGRRASRPRLELLPGGGAPAAARYVFAVTLLAGDGAEWEAVGGGATVNEALAFAVASAPAGRDWRPVYWHELYGD